MALYDELPLNTPTKVYENAEAELWATRTLNGGTLESRPKPGSLAANQATVEAGITAALAQLDAIIAFPAVPTVPAGATLTATQLTTVVNALRTAAQQNRAGIQDVALILKRLIRLVRGDFTGTS